MAALLYRSIIAAYAFVLVDALMNHFISNQFSYIYLLLFLNVSQKCEWDESNTKLLKGPIIVKTDSGRGRLAATMQSVNFREKMW